MESRGDGGSAGVHEDMLHGAVQHHQRDRLQGPQRARQVHHPGAEEDGTARLNLAPSWCRQGSYDVFDFLQWVDLCEGFLVEARWFSGGVVPEMEEYVGNGVSTAGTYMAFVHAFYLIGSGVNKQSSDVVNSCPKLFTSAGRILRLWDDLGTAKVRIFVLLIS